MLVPPPQAPCLSPIPSPDVQLVRRTKRCDRPPVGLVCETLPKRQVVDSNIGGSQQKTQLHALHRKKNKNIFKIKKEPRESLPPQKYYISFSCLFRIENNFCLENNNPKKIKEPKTCGAAFQTEELPCAALTIDKT